jgi:hypothetical protein
MEIVKATPGPTRGPPPPPAVGAYGSRTTAASGVAMRKLKLSSR